MILPLEGELVAGPVPAAEDINHPVEVVGDILIGWGVDLSRESSRKRTFESEFTIFFRNNDADLDEQ